MELVALNLIILMGVAAYFVGAFRLAKYGFRLGTGVGLAVILFPPYTFYFAFKKLEIDGKALPTSLCAFGLLCTGLLIFAFFQPLSAMATGNFAEAQELLSEDILREAPDDDDNDVEESEEE